jgi:DNA-binding MarR family transcriptional regulator
VFPIGVEVEALENGQALAEKDAEIAALKAENENLKVSLQMANAELETFRAERKKQQEEERKRDIPEIQFEILKWLAEGVGPKDVSEIANAFSLPVYEADVHLRGLDKKGFVESGYNAYEAVIWGSTTKGNQLVLAKRLVGGEEAKKAYKHADLPQIQQEALLLMARSDEGINERELNVLIKGSLALIRHNLHSLREADMATDAEESLVETYESDDEPYSPTWRVLRKGEAYLAERDLL